MDHGRSPMPMTTLQTMRKSLGLGGLTPQIEITAGQTAAQDFQQKWSDLYTAVDRIWTRGLQSGDDGSVHSLSFLPNVPPDLVTDPQLQGLDPTGPKTKPNLWRITYQGRVKFTEGRWYPPSGADIVNDYLHTILPTNDLTSTPMWGQRYNGDIYYQGGAGTLVRVLTKPVTAWAAMTGTATRTAFATYPVTTAASAYSQSDTQAMMTQLQKLSERVKALTDDLGATTTLTSQGLIGP